jgi:hypothetical protein
VAADFSPLWKNIWLCPQPSTVGTPEVTEHLLEVLQRSKSAPFSLQIRWPWSGFHWNLDTRFLARFSPALTRLTLLFRHHSSALMALTSLPSGSFPRLERLIIDRFESMDVGIDDIVAFKDTPCLSHVAIHHWFFDKRSGIVKIDLPWSQLSHFSKHRGVNGEATTTLLFLERHLPRFSSRLRYLTLPVFDGSNPEASVWAQLPSMHIGNLESLTLQFLSMDPYPWFLDKFECPRLKSIRIEALVPEHFDVDNVSRLWRTLSRFSSLVHLSYDAGAAWRCGGSSTVSPTSKLWISWLPTMK